MNSRPFHDTTVSEIGLGTWQLGADWAQVSDSDAQAILGTALESGVNFFDTADVYGLGHSERRIAEFLQRTGADVTVATKLGRFPKPGWPHNFTPEAITEHTEASLERLQVDALDLTQLHCIPTEQLREGAVFDALRDLRTQGKIRRFGASVESMEEALICLEQDGLGSLQIIFNIYRQKPIDALFEAAKTKGVALIVRLPLASGLLSGKFSAKTTFGESDHRNYNRNGDAFNVGETFAGLEFAKALELTEQLKTIVPPEIPLAQLAMRWILDHDAVSVVIPGATKVEQVVSNCAAANLEPLPSELHSKLCEFYQSSVSKHIRGPY